jgi:thiamine-phosphate pyrophosphorylase
LLTTSEKSPDRLPAKVIVCYVSDGRSLGASDRVGSVLTRIRTAVAAGVDWVQIREKDLPTRKLLELVRAAVDAAHQETAKTSASRIEKTRVVVNDRLDVALAAGADGVHLREESVSARQVVRWCRDGNAPTEFLVGVSCHNLGQVREAEDAGASYAFFGPVFDTPPKRQFGPPQGILGLGEVCRVAKIPVIAIGGVNEENTADCVTAGAAGIAAIRLFQEARQTGALANVVENLHRLKQS